MIDKILITQPIDPAGTDMLEAAGCAIDVWSGPDPMPREELLKRLQGCVGMISMLNDTVDDSVFAAGPLRVVAQHAVGVNNIDLAAARVRGVALAHTPGVLTDATADLAMALLLSTARRIVESDRYVRADKFKGWSPTLMRGMDLRGATLGIVGLGRIGQAVAERAAGFGMKIIHHNRTSGVSMTELLKHSDVISLHCPLTEETRHLIDANALKAMKNTAILINTARGPVVDESALVHALQSGIIAAAGLDVFEEEPVVHPGLMSCDNAVLLPHIGSATMGTRKRMAEMVAENIILGLGGKPLSNPVEL
ncbi:MAG: D-glycerate dehydrogenase [Deltaproteobacteria bacterium]|nr:D-glycerate dehydrogenase [Deltaproteobacteria bacterium]